MQVFHQLLKLRGDKMPRRGGEGAGLYLLNLNAELPTFGQQSLLLRLEVSQLNRVMLSQVMLS